MSGSSMSGKAMLGLTLGLTLIEFPLPAWLPLPALLPLPFPFPAELPLPFPFPLPLPLPRKLLPLPALGLVMEPMVLVMPERPSRRPRAVTVRVEKMDGKVMVLPFPAELPEPAVLSLPLLLPAELLGLLVVVCGC